MRYYDRVGNRLVYIESIPDERFWDSHWSCENRVPRYGSRVSRFNLVVNQTKKYLPQHSVILEGGAGLALNSWYLHLAGYRVIALDFAPKTVALVRKTIPEVNPVLGDVRKIPLKDGGVDGYWSLGVIEHFCEGFEPLREEMWRVLKKDGFLFVTFPHMSILRRIKAVSRIYPKWGGEQYLLERFYQFAFDERIIVDDFQRRGFVFVKRKTLDGLKGLKDELVIGKRYLQRIYDGKRQTARVLKKAMDVCLRCFSSHSVLLVFRKP